MSVVAYTATPSEFVCRARVFFPTVSFGLTFGMLMLKTYRIYLIFGYRHISAARSIRNWALINLTILIAVIEIALCCAYVFVTQPVLAQVYLTTSSTSDNAVKSLLATSSASYLTCRPGDGKHNLSQILEAIMFTFNAGIMVISLYLAFKTRGAYKRYVESKAIGLTTYVVAVSLLVALPVIYVIPI
ncbi:7 transmembrane sweet-taste receptor of 3 GCPR-domain-containing protein, partial [Chytridium lagenaria]